MRVFSIKDNNHTEIYKTDSKKSAVEWCDTLLFTTNNYSLFTELNNIQLEINTERNPAFAIKTKFPLCILNLVLSKFNLMLVSDPKDKDEV